MAARKRPSVPRKSVSGQNAWDDEVLREVYSRRDAYAAEHGVSVVLDGGNQQVPVVIYTNPSVDITKAVIDAYNVKSGIPAPEASAAGPAPKGTTSPARSTTAPKATTPH